MEIRDLNETTKSMTLTIKERFILLHVLPKEGNLTTLRIVRELRESLSFSEKEHADYKIKFHENGMVTWDETCDFKKDIPIGNVAMSVISDQLKKMDREKTLMEDHLDIWDVFVKEA